VGECSYYVEGYPVVLISTVLQSISHQSRIVQNIPFRFGVWFSIFLLTFDIAMCVFRDNPKIHDLTPILAAFRPDLLQDYLNGTIIIKFKDYPFAVCFLESKRDGFSL
jgi:hypothetical protein